MSELEINLRNLLGIELPNGVETVKLKKGKLSVKDKDGKTIFSVKG